MAHPLFKKNIEQPIIMPKILEISFNMQSCDHNRSFFNLYLYYCL